MANGDETLDLNDVGAAEPSLGQRLGLGPGAPAPGAAKPKLPHPLLFLIPGFWQGFASVYSQRVTRERLDAAERRLGINQSFATLREITKFPKSIRGPWIDHWATTHTNAYGPVAPVFIETLKKAGDEEAATLRQLLGDAAANLDPDTLVSLAGDANKGFDLAVKSFEFKRGEAARREFETGQEPAEAPAIAETGRQMFFRTPAAGLPSEVQVQGPPVESPPGPHPLALEPQDELETLKRDRDRLHVLLGRLPEAGRAGVRARLDAVNEQIKQLEQPTFQTDVGKLAADRRLLARLGAAPGSPAMKAIDRQMERLERGTAESTAGKLGDDLARARRIHGEGSPQAQAVAAELERERRGLESPTGKLGQDLETFRQVFGPQSIQAQAVEAQLRREQQGPGQQDDRQKLMNAYTDASKRWVIVRLAYDRMLNATDDAAGDAAVLFAFGKFQDPNSAILEGERAFFENTRGWSEELRNLYNRALTGRRISAPQRERFLRQGKAQFRSELRFQVGLERQYQDMAKKGGIDPSQVTIDYIGEFRKMFKGRAATSSEVNAARQQAQGDAMRARAILIEQGIDPTLAVVPDE